MVTVSKSRGISGEGKGASTEGGERAGGTGRPRTRYAGGGRWCTAERERGVSIGGSVESAREHSRRAAEGRRKTTGSRLGDSDVAGSASCLGLQSTICPLVAFSHSEIKKQKKPKRKAGR